MLESRQPPSKVDAKGSFWHTYWRPILIIAGSIFVIALWWILSITINKTLIPNPYETLIRTFNLLGQGETWKHLGHTLMRLLLAFSVSFLVGSLLGLFAGLNKYVKAFLRPLILVLRTLPTAAIILLFIAVFSSSRAPYYVVFLVVFPLTYEAMVSGIDNISKRYLDPLRLDGKYRFRSIWQIIFPLASPYVLLGILQSLGLGIKVEIMSEILSGNTTMYGIGVAIKSASDILAMKDVFAYSLLTILLIALFEICLYFVKKTLKK